MAEGRSIHSRKGHSKAKRLIPPLALWPKGLAGSIAHSFSSNLFSGKLTIAQSGGKINPRQKNIPSPKDGEGSFKFLITGSLPREVCFLHQLPVMVSVAVHREETGDLSENFLHRKFAPFLEGRGPPG